MTSNLSRRRIGFLLTDLFIAALVMLAIGLVGVWSGVLASVIAFSGLTTVAFMRQARAMASGRPVSSLLRAERLSIINSAGKPTVRLDSDGLWLTDNAGRARIRLGVAGQEPGLAFLDEAGKVRACFGVATDGQPYLHLNDKAEITQLSLRSANDGSAGILVADQSGMTRGSLSVAADGRPGLDLYDAKGKARATVVVGLDGASVLMLKDEASSPRAQVVVHSDGTPFLIFCDGRDRVRVRLAIPGPRAGAPMTDSETKALLREIADASPSEMLEKLAPEYLREFGSGLSFQDHEGKITWKAP